MGDGPQSNAGDNEKAEPAAIENQLPIVWSPKLEAADAGGESSTEGADAPSTTGSETIDETARGTVAAAAPIRSPHSALLAASIALAALFGGFAGSLSASGFAHFWPTSDARSSTTETGALPAMKADLAELAALKANLEGAIRNANGQLVKIAERLDHVERAQIDPAVKIAHIVDTVDRLDKRGAATPEITGTVAPSQPSADTKPPERILQDWVVEDVRRGRALVLNRYGGVFDVSSGSVLPGLGRVETIKRQDGGWVVVTARGLITSGR